MLLYSKALRKKELVKLDLVIMHSFLVKKYLKHDTKYIDFICQVAVEVSPRNVLYQCISLVLT